MRTSVSFAVLVVLLAASRGGAQETQKPEVVPGSVIGIYRQGLMQLMIDRPDKNHAMWGINLQKKKPKLTIDGKDAELKDFRLRDKVEIVLLKHKKPSRPLMVTEEILEIRVVERNEKLSKRGEEFEALRVRLLSTLTNLKAGETDADRTQRAARIADEVFTLVAGDPRDVVSADALMMLLKDLADRPRPGALEDVRARAGDLLIEHHPSNGKFVFYITGLRFGDRSPKGMLEKLIDARGAGRGLQAEACELVARRAFQKSYQTGDKDETALAEKYYQRLKKDFPEIKLFQQTMGERADQALYALDKLWVGKPAMAIEGVTMDGKKARLSDFRGKVVFLTFFSSSYNFAAEHRLLKAHQGQPFVALGVCIDPNEQYIKTLLPRNKVDWPVWYDGKDGPIGKQWLTQAGGLTYVLDAQGVIRFKGIAGTLDKTVAALVKEAEKK